MAGRSGQRPTSVAVLSVATVQDTPTQRALEQIQDATQNLQIDVRRLRTGVVAGRLLARKVITASGIYEPTAGAVRALVRMVGGGGGGGGAASAVAISVGGGGASGVLIEFTLGPDSSDVGPLDSGSVSIGAAGAAGTSAPGAGGVGGDSTLTIGPTVYRAKGGNGGAAGSMDGIGTAAGGIPASGSTAGVPQAASHGGWGLIIDASGNGLQGIGGPTPLGHSIRAAVVGTPPVQAAGFGAGGSGAITVGVASSAGGQGAPGVVIVEEFS